MTGAILVVTDLAEAERFYQRSFGWCTVDCVRDTSGAPQTITLAGEGNRLVLSGPDHAHQTASPRETGWNSVALIQAVANLDDLVSRFVAAGGRLLSGPKPRPWGVRAALMEAPDGHRWMLEEREETE